MRCKFCGKDWVQGCWTADEAHSCGNNDGSILPRLQRPQPAPLPKRLQRQIDRQQDKLRELYEKADEYRKTHANKSS
jgi:hypothetical protein